MRGMNFEATGRYCQENFEDAKGLIRSCKSKKDKQYNGQKKRSTEQSIMYKTLQKPGMNTCDLGRASSSSFIIDIYIIEDNL